MFFLLSFCINFRTSLYLLAKVQCSERLLYEPHGYQEINQEHNDSKGLKSAQSESMCNGSSKGDASFYTLFFLFAESFAFLMKHTDLFQIHLSVFYNDF